MKYQINEYLNPLFIKASTDFMTESEKAKQQERQRETESEKAEQRERQRARVEWDDSCGRDSAFKKQWDSEIFNINRALDTQPHTSTTSSDLSRRILKIRASYTACKSMKGALQKKAEIAELREQLNQLIQKYDKFRGQQQTSRGSQDKAKSEPGSDNWDKKCGSNSDFKKQWNSNISSIELALDRHPYTAARSKKLSEKIKKLATSYENCKSIDGAGLKQPEINKLKDELNQLIRKYSKFNDEEEDFIDVEDLHTGPSDHSASAPIPTVPDVPVWVTPETERTHANLTKIILSSLQHVQWDLMVAIEPASGGLFGETRKKIAVVFTGINREFDSPLFQTIDMKPHNQLFGTTPYPQNPVNQNKINILILIGGEICLLISTLDLDPKFLTKDNSTKTRYIYKKINGELNYCNITDFGLVFLNGDNTPSDLGDYYGERGSNLFALREYIASL